MSQDNREINNLLDSFKNAAESADESSFKDRKEARKKIREHLRAKHWGNDVSSDPVANPSLQLTWLAIERMHPKIFNGYSFEPEVIPEVNQQYLVDPNSPLRQALAQVPGKPNEADSAKEAKIKTAIAQRLWEQANGLDVVKEGGLGSLHYGDWYFLDGWDDSVFFENLHPDFVRTDPDAKTKNDSRFIAYFLERTVAELKATYPDKADEIKASIEADDKAKDLPDDKVKVQLECWFIKDRSKKKVTDREEITIDLAPQYEQDGYSIAENKTAIAPPLMVNGMAYHPGTMQPITAALAEGYEVTVGYVVEREREEEKYPGGWRHVKRAGKVVLYDGPNYSANGELPIHWLPCYPTPGEFANALGVPDQVKDLNIMIDVLMGEALEYVRKTRPGIIGQAGIFEEGNFELMTVPGGGPQVLKVVADETKSIAEALYPYQFPDLPASHQAMIDRLVNILEQVTGSYDLNGQNAAYDQLSGEAVEQLETAAHGRLSTFRARVRNVIRDVVRNMLANWEKYGDGKMAVEVQAFDGYKEVEVSPEMFSDDEFERNFDIVVGSTDTLPPTGRARNEVVLGSVNALLPLGPTMAPQILQVLELPEKAAIEAALNQHFQQMQQQGAPDPLQIAKAEAEIEAQKQAQGSLLDGLEDLAKDKNLSLPARLVALKYIQFAAMGQPVPPMQIISQEILAVNQPALVPMGTPSAQPQGMQ